MPVLFFLLLGGSVASEIYIPTSFLAFATYEDGTDCSETSAYKIQTPGNYPEESTQRLEHDESLKSRIKTINYDNT